MTDLQKALNYNKSLKRVIAKQKEKLDIANRVMTIQDERIDFLHERLDEKIVEWCSLKRYESLFWLSATINIALGIILLFVGAKC